MFCYQCQETAKNSGCTVNGVCGKTGDVAELQDLLLYVAKGISFWNQHARGLGIQDKIASDAVVKALFVTITNVNFDADRIAQLITEGLKIRDKVRTAFVEAYAAKQGSQFSAKVPPCADWNSEVDMDEYIEKGAEVGVLAMEDDDVRSLQELLIYGLKGAAAYADHAAVLGYVDDSINAAIESALVASLDHSRSVDSWLELIMEAGKTSVSVMALLDKANTESFGIPEITEVSTGTIAGPGILVSGHDLKDLEELLQQTENSGVNVYTHGEMLPANAYPKLKQFKQLVGNFGTSWYNQQQEFTQFNGPVLFTTNCLQKPKDNYKDRVYTTGLAGWDGIKHIADRTGGKAKDFSAIIAHAKKLGSLAVKPGKKLTIGFNHNTTLALAGPIIDAVKAGSIKRFIVMAGCDGRHKERDYFTQVAQTLPADTVILTAGCAKYRYNMLDLGSIGGIPRVIDAGQCNDSYSLAVVALKLVEAFGLQNLNELPLSFDIAWYEQKAVCVLLALLYLGVKNIRLGPTLPAFLSPDVANVLVQKFDLKLITTPQNDVKKMLEGK